jgi:hypothetical protein
MVANTETSTLEYLVSPAKLAGSALWSHGGFLSLPDLLTKEIAERLAAEAAEVRPKAVRTVHREIANFEERGGKPARAFRSGPAQDLHRNVYCSARVISMLSGLCNLPVVALGAGTFSYYEEPGDFLGLHRDIIGCDLAIISCLSSSSIEIGEGCLVAYPNHIDAPLSTIRKIGRTAASPIPLAFGETVVILGGFVAHEVTPMAAGNERIIAVTCYRLVA